MMSYAAMTTVPFLNPSLPPDAVPPPVHMNASQRMVQQQQMMQPPPFQPAAMPPQPMAQTTADNNVIVMATAAGKANACIHYCYPNMPEYNCLLNMAMYH